MLSSTPWRSLNHRGTLPNKTKSSSRRALKWQPGECYLAGNKWVSRNPTVISVNYLHQTRELMSPAKRSTASPMTPGLLRCTDMLSSSPCGRSLTRKRYGQKIWANSKHLDLVNIFSHLFKKFTATLMVTAGRVECVCRKKLSCKWQRFPNRLPRVLG